MTLTLELERLQFCLTRLRCPAFLHVHTEQQQQRVSSCAFRKTLLLWLFAVYRSPSVRLLDDSDENWTKHEPSPQELLQWLRLMVRSVLHSYCCTTLFILRVLTCVVVCALCNRELMTRMLLLTER